MNYLIRFKSLIKNIRFIYDIYNSLRILLNIIYFKIFGPMPTMWNFNFIGSIQMSRGKFENNETQFFLKTISSYDLFINIGANIGYYVCHAANNNVETISFEPLNSNLNYLYKNISQFNNLNLVYPIALSNYRGISQIYGSNMMASLIPDWDMGKKNDYVSTMYFDDFYKEQFNNKKIFILIDAEGSEFNILEKSQLFLKNKTRPIWFIEIQNYEHQPDSKFNKHFDETFKIFKNLGYKVSYLHDGEIINLGYDNLKNFIMLNPYIKNFIFD